jgi:hypothetical protein
MRHFIWVLLFHNLGADIKNGIVVYVASIHEIKERSI